MNKIMYGCVTILLITFLIWIVGKDPTSLSFQQLPRMVSQISALFGIVLMAYTLIWSSRIRAIESKVGGFDIMMKSHHIIGMVAFLLLIHHPLLLAIQGLPSTQIALSYFLPGGDISFNLGVYSFYIMIFSLVTIAFIKIPYHVFRNTHQFLGLAFLLGGAHAMTIGSDIGENIVLRIWILFWVVVGLWGALYIIFIYPFFGPKHTFFVSSVKRVGDVVHITLRALGNSFQYAPGQFCFLSFISSDISKEPHPFTISSVLPDGKHIRISAKILGDYTLTLTRLQTNTLTYVYGPYGLFGEKAKNAKEQIWIAGGIGITPFISMLAKAKQDTSKRIIFVYISRDNEPDLFLDELRSELEDCDHIYFLPWFTKKQGRPTAEAIMKVTESSIDSHVLLCGPTQMMDALQRQFMAQGIVKNHIHSESFAMI